MPDAIIVGAGLAGLSLAAQLPRSWRVLLLEQGAQHGAEASAQNAAMLRTMGEDPYERALSCRTEDRLADPPERWSTWALSRRTGALLGLVRDPHHLHDAAAHLRARGLPVQDCDRPEELAPALRGSPLRQAWYLPSARVVDPHALMEALRADLVDRGGELRCHSPVTGLDIVGGRIRGLHTPQQSLSTARVVLAAGAWCAQLARRAGLERPLIPLRRSLVQTAAHALSSPDHPWVWLDDVGVYARPEAGGWLGSDCDESVDWPEPGPGSLGPLEPEPRARWMHKLQRYLPALAEVRPSGGWSGLRTFAPDRRPYLGADPDVEGLWWAAGLGGSGVSCSLAAGEALAAWMTDRPTPWVGRQGLSPGRPLPRRWSLRPTGDIHGARWVDRPSPP